MHEVEVEADTAGLLRRMRKAHAGAVHRLHDPREAAGLGEADEAWDGADGAALEFDRGA